MNREIYIPAISDEEYYRLGEYNATQLLNHCSDKELDVVVDYGCGDGRVARYIATNCQKIICADIGEFVLQDAERILNGFEVHNAEFKFTNDIREEGFADLVYTFQVIQHCSDSDQLDMVNHIQSMLKPDGIACIHMPKIEDKPLYHNNNMCMCFTRAQVEYFGKMFSHFAIAEWEFTPQWVDYYLWVRK